MKKEASIKDWKRMYDKLTDPETQAKARRDKERKERMEEKLKDTGI